MSASLVGSEMCIRDSCAAAAPSGHRQVGCRGPLSGLPGCPSWAGHVSSCLLYTSDAADDM
eukprot:15414826-Alexandrium_andersonii.AAC.1